MFKKLLYPILIAVLISVIVSSTVFAAGPTAAAAGKEKPASNRVRARGLVSAVDASAGTFSITGKDGQVWSFTVVDRTQYRGEVKSLTDLKVGMQAGAAARKNGEKLVALVVLGRTAPQRAAGTVTGVDQAQGSFTLDAKNGQTYTIFINADTKFHGLDGKFQSLADLKPSALVAVRMVPDAQGQYLAKMIIAKVDK